MTNPKKPKALVVEDYASVAEFVRRALEEAGYDVLEAATKASAINRKLNDGPFDLIVLDNRFPVFRDGFAEKLGIGLAAAWKGDAAIVMHTSDPLDVECARLGVGYVAKGDGMAALLAECERQRAKRRAA